MENYYLGLDVGTDSIGWAVTDEQYNIPKFKGNAMWGIRLLEGGETANDRRVFRSARRRTQRNKFRRQCLEMLFNGEIAQKDPAFFQRLNDSAYNKDDDRKVTGKYSLFNDKNYTDTDYFKEYPTIYHLRKELITNSCAHDVRLVYLALSHIIKNRGHFLFDNEDFAKGDELDFKNIWQEFNAYVTDNYYEDGFNCADLDELEKRLKNQGLTITKKKAQLAEILEANKKDSFKTAVIALLSGGTVRAKELFGTEEYEDTEAKSINLKDGYDDKAVIYESVFAENFELVERIKAIYDWAILADILDGEKYISFSKVKEYEKHKKDLKLLKEYVKEYLPEKRKLIFDQNDEKTQNYLAYSGYCKKGSVEKRCSQEEFCKFLAKELPKEPAEEKYAQMYNEIAAGVFMPKAVTKDNSVIPMQVNREELKAILKNACKYLPFLNQKDNVGKTVSEKIEDIFNFRIPYYVGPLNNHSDKSWVVRTNEKIYPWNFEQVVDVDKSAEGFIANLTSKCTYLTREDVLAKNSLLYSTYKVLNEINNLKIDGEPISVELKQGIYTDLFAKHSRVTMKMFKNYLASHGITNVQVTGVDDGFKSSLKPFIDLEFIDLPESDKEEIIKAVTIFGEEKKLLKKRLAKKYGDKLSAEDISKISRLKYTDWGALSKKLLTGIEAVNKETGEYTNIIRTMWQTNDNLMQVIFSEKYKFKEAIDNENGIVEFTTLKDEVDKLYVSPKIKRPIYQTMQIVEEIVKIQKHEPEKIFIEVAREKGNKGERKDTRKNQLLALYEKCKKEEETLYNQLLKTDEKELRRDSLYFYYTQMGKCMYTGKTIELSDLYNKNIWDIDHIYPRSKIKDDSLDNRVLVYKPENQKKDNAMISEEIRSSRISYWKMLLSKGLISKEKFNRLTRNTELTEDEINSFTNRQLVETRQSTKALAQLLEKRYPTAKIEYIKAGLASDFRQKHDMIKSRDVNDLHHAKDAYLNIVVGNVYTVKARNIYFAANIKSGAWSLERMFDFDVKGAWRVAENRESMKIVENTMKKNNILFTRYAYQQHGGLFKVTILKKRNGQVPIKKGLSVDEYGGYTSPASTFFAYIEYADKKGKTIRSFEPVDLYIKNEYEENPEEFMAKRLKNMGVEASDIKILIPCVKYDALININGFNMHISSKDSGGIRLNCKPAVQLILTAEQEQYVKKASKCVEKYKDSKEKSVTKYDEVSEIKNIDLYTALANKMTDTVYNVKFKDIGEKLKGKQSAFEQLSLYDQCYTLMEIIKIIHANVVTGDLTKIGESKNCGRIRISNKISKEYKSAKLINQSVTGLFKNEIDLLENWDN